MDVLWCVGDVHGVRKTMAGRWYTGTASRCVTNTLTAMYIVCAACLLLLSLAQICRRRHLRNVSWV